MSDMAETQIVVEPFSLRGTLSWPERSNALIVFAHGSGSSRLSPRNVQVADALNARGMATFLFDLLTREEEVDRRNVFDIPLLADRLIGAVRWLDQANETGGLYLGLFGIITGFLMPCLASSWAKSWSR